MVRRLLIFVVGALFLMGPNSAAVPLDSLSKDEAAIAIHIKALHDSKSEVRAAAAEALRIIVAKYPSRSVYIRSKDAGEAYWTEKIKQVKPGMTRAQVLKIIPHLPEAPGALNMASGQRNWDSYQLDYHWDVRVLYDNGKGRKGDRADTVSEYSPTLTRRAWRVHVEPPKNYTGTWISWHVNGQKGYETQYQNGKYQGAHTTFYDNGQKFYEQHYKNHIADGAGAGWYSDGKKSYTLQYQNGKRAGKCTHWYANGQKQCEDTYKNGAEDGVQLAWHENGQLRSVTTYSNGVKNGPEERWDEDGALEYRRLYQNGTIVDP
jgi:hypothetical protein